MLSIQFFCLYVLIQYIMRQDSDDDARGLYTGFFIQVDRTEFMEPQLLNSGKIKRTGI
jgi:hypothetical protein